MSKLRSLQRQVDTLEREHKKHGVKPKPADWPMLLTDAMNAWLRGENVDPVSGYVNDKTGKAYKPHSREEWSFISDLEHRYLLLKGGEGSGKTTSGCIRNMERVRAGASGIMVSPDLPHFAKSLWPEARRWIPWDFVVPGQRYRSSFDWEPTRPFQLSFVNGATIFCGGIKESEVMAWEGPNVSWCHFDEPRRHKTAAALKVIDGRVRLVEGGYPPQIWLTSTPRMNWLFEFFGPVGDNDPLESFKGDSLVITLLTKDNLENLSADYLERRAQTLTVNEALVYLDAQWIDVDEGESYLPNITLWDLCKAEIPPIDGKGDMVFAADAATGRISGWSDCFAIVGVSRHWEKERHEDVAVRYFRTWRARPGQKIDFQAEDGPEEEIRRLCEDYGPVCFVYDRHELHSMMTRLNKEGIAWFYEFGQQTERLVADKQLLDMIVQRRLVHGGDPELREHMSNANRRLDKDGRKLRIVKREDQLPVDGAVALSMCSAQATRLNI